MQNQASYLRFEGVDLYGFTVNSVYLRRFFRNFSSKKYQKISQVSQNKDSHTGHAAFEETSFTQFPWPQLIVVLESANFLYI